MRRSPRTHSAMAARPDVSCVVQQPRRGKPLHVDHIEAVSKNWARRFDKENLQVMCEDCNIGKLNGPAADFRPTELATK